MFARTPRNQTRRLATSLAVIVAGGLAGVAIRAPVAAAPDGQWYLDALHVRQAHTISTGRGVTVAVIDSGIDKTRPALSGHLVPGKCFGSAEALPPTMDDNGHGTGMAGLIGGNGKDRRHILGLAPGASLMPLCVTGENITQNSALTDITPAIRYAVDHGAKIISLSLGADEQHALDSTVTKLHKSIAYAEAHNVVVIAAAGNTDKDVTGVASPAKLPGVVAVAGTTESGARWSESATGDGVALAAPAEHILSLDTTNKFKDGKPVGSTGYQIASGTSSATALVAGAAALVRAKYPRLDAANVINRLIKTADHKGAAGRNPQYGYGIVDPVKALTAHVAPVSSNPLGQLDTPGASSGSSKAAAAPGKSGKPSGSSLGVWTAIGVAVLVILVVLIIVLVARARRRKAVAAGGSQPGGQPTRSPGSPPTESIAPSSTPARPAPPNRAAPATSSTQPDGPGGRPRNQEPPDKYEIQWRKP